jgi:hypothetical protein
MPDPIAIESAATPEVQRKAEQMGWIPPTRFKGEPERFVDAEEYLARGEQVLPIVRANNQKLQQELDGLRAESAKTREALEKANAALEEINERHSVETQKAVERAREDLKLRLKAASEEGDHEAVAEITGLMIDLKAASEEPLPKKKEAAKEEPKPAALAVPEDLKAWNAANPWFGTDRRRTSLALGIAQEMRESGTELTGVAFYEKIREEVEATFGEFSSGSKVEGARSGGEAEGGTRRTTGKKGFASLPADARAACDADAKQFVGPGKRFKTADEWRARYAELYFQEN